MSGQKKKMEGNPDANLVSIGNYTLMKTLGEGNFAKVKLAKHKLTGQEVAIKIIDKTQLDEKKLSKLYREVRVMKLLHHPNIVKLYEVVETKHTIFLVMELVSGGELYDYLVVHGRMKEKEAKAKFRQIISAVHYCHSKRVIHRDLKAENLLLDSNMDVKIADFGFSNQFDPDGKLDTFCGSPPYAAPELFQGKRYTGPEVDIWSLGVILYVLSTGCLPFDGKNLQEMRESVCRGKYRLPFYLSEGCEKLLRKFLVRDPTKRPSLDIIMDDPWLNEGYDGSPCAPVSQFDQAIPEDELILTIMESKFGVEKELVRKGIKENVYDEIMAIYFLLFSEKQKNGEAAVIKIGEQMALKNPHIAEKAAANTAPAIQNTAISVIKEEEDGNNNIILLPNDASKRRPSVNAGNNSASKSNGNSVPPSPTTAHASPANSRVQAPNNATAAAAAVPVRRNRRFTVGNENDMKEFENDKDSPGMLEKLKNIQVNGDQNGAEPQVRPRQLASDVKARPITMAVDPFMSAAKKDDRLTTPDRKTVIADGRKRTNTITGFLKIGKQPGDSQATDAKQQQATAQQVPRDITESSEAVDGGDSGDGSKPRSLRFTFNSNTTSSKQPDEIVQELINACQRLNIRTRNISRYVIECLCNPPNNLPGAEPIKIEVEICKLPRLKNLHGLKFKRISGASNDYKTLCEQLLAAVAL